jgi:hypothetical protein
MPIALDPAQVVSFSLDIDKKTPEDIRPAFSLGYLTCRQTLQYEQAVNAAAERGTQAERNARLNRTLAIVIRGWRNMCTPAGEAIAYEPGDPISGDWPALDGILSVEEKWEMVLGARKAIRLAEEDKKKSLSPPPGDAEPSAAAAGGSAPTPPAN